MVKSFLAVSVACLCAIAAYEPAFSQSTLTVHPRSAIPLPANVMTSDDWLDPGEPAPVHSNNNYARMVEAPVDVQVGPDLDQNW
jgi:hypothetical protein